MGAVMEDQDHIELALNAEGDAPEWVHLLPAEGLVAGRDGRRFVLEDAEAVARNSLSGKDIPIDYEHQTEPAERAKVTGPIPAAGWVKELSVRNDGIWGRVEWTARARELIAAKEYRYLSPVFFYGQKTGIISRITSVGLVHQPNLELKALSSEQPAATKPPVPDVLAMIAAALDLPEGADAETVVAEIAKLKAAPALPLDVAKQVMRERNEAMAAMSEKAVFDRVETALARGQIAPAMREWATALCRTDPESFEDFCTSTAPMFGHLGRSQMETALHREGLDNGRNAASSQAETEIAAALGIPPDRLR